jgi:hypothetical protein
VQEAASHSEALKLELPPGLKAVTVPGNCQFEAIARQLSIYGQIFQTHLTYSDVHQQVTKWLTDHSQMSRSRNLEAQGFDHDSTDLTELIKQPGVEITGSDKGYDLEPQWDDHQTLVAAANLYQRPIHVLLCGRAQPLEVSPTAHSGSRSQQHKPLLLLLMGGKHYMSVEADNDTLLC